MHFDDYVNCTDQENQAKSHGPASPLRANASKRTATMELVVRRRTRVSFCFAVTGLLSLVCGCTTLGISGSDTMDLVGESPETLSQPQKTPSISVELRPSGKKPEISQIPLTRGMLIQQALEQAGAVKRFRRMDVRLMRAARDQRQKLEVKYDHEKGGVNPLYDYALHPGDHVVAIEDTATILDDMLQSISGPVGHAVGR